MPHLILVGRTLILTLTRSQALPLTCIIITCCQCLMSISRALSDIWPVPSPAARAESASVGFDAASV